MANGKNRIKLNDLKKQYEQILNEINKRELLCKPDGWGMQRCYYCDVEGFVGGSVHEVKILHTWKENYKLIVCSDDCFVSMIYSCQGGIKDVREVEGLSLIYGGKRYSFMYFVEQYRLFESHKLYPKFWKIEFIDDSKYEDDIERALQGNIEKNS